MALTLIKYGAVGIAIVVVALVAYYRMKPTQKRLYNKAASLHKQGELYYNDGDAELAEEYYRESEMLREKARGLA